MITNPVLAQLMVDLQTATVEYKGRLFRSKRPSQSEPLAGERIVQNRSEVDVLGITPLSLLRK
jgi:hypothetical protein